MSDYPFYPYVRGAPGEDAASRYSSYEIDLIAARYAGDPSPYPSASGAFDVHVGARRPADVLYHQSIMGSHSTIGQSEALYSPNTMVKRPRLESSLPIYPQRPGEKYCDFYMRSRTCLYGEACIFDHPQWVQEVGISNWKEAPTVEESYPVRPGEPDCPFFIRTSKCNFGSKCKFNHPNEKDNATVVGTGNEESLVSESENKASVEAAGHNRVADDSVSAKKLTPVAKEHNSKGAANDSVSAKKLTPVAKEHNSKGLPIRPGEVDCSFYVRTGSCMYGSLCRFNHPDRHCQVLDFPLAAPLGQSLLPTPLGQSLLPTPLGQSFLPTPSSVMLNPAANFLPSFDFHAPIEPEPFAYPQRPGETVCDFYMKTGFCKFLEKCKFHHPVDRSAPDTIANLEASQQPVTLTLAGLPRRENAEICAFYMKTGTCKFGSQCKFDHPPPGEAIAKVSEKDGGKNKVAIAKVSKQGEEREGGKKKVAFANVSKQGEKKEGGKKKVVGLSIVLEN